MLPFLLYAIATLFFFMAYNNARIKWYGWAALFFICGLLDAAVATCILFTL